MEKALDLTTTTVKMNWQTITLGVSLLIAVTIQYQTISTRLDRIEKSQSTSMQMDTGRFIISDIEVANHATNRLSEQELREMIDGVFARYFKN